MQNFFGADAPEEQGQVMTRILKYNEAKLGIAQLIRQNKLRPGDKLASERELASQLGMSIISVRRAMAEFQDAGIIRKKSGVGSFYNGNLSLENHANQVALVNIGDSLYPDSVTISAFEETLRQYDAKHKVFHVKRDVEPDVLTELQEFDKIAITGYINLSWLECLSSLGKPTLQIGESECPNSLSKVKPDWRDAFRLVFKRFRTIDRKNIAFLLPDLKSSTYGALLQGIAYDTARQESCTLSESLIANVPFENAIGAIEDMLRHHAKKIQLLVIENGSLLPFLLAPSRRKLPVDLPIVVIHESVIFPQDILTLGNIYCVTLVENILSRVANLFYTKPCTFFSENQTSFIKAKLLEPARDK